MSDSDPMNKVFNSEEVIENINLLQRSLSQFIIHKQKTELTDIDKEIIGLTHQMAYFSILVNFFYPLEVTHKNLKTNSAYSDDEAAKAQVLMIDLLTRESFLTLNCFSFETLLHVIAEKHKISFDNHDSIIAKYMKVIDYFEVEDASYKGLLKIVYCTRNSLHSGTRIKKEWNINYKGQTFSAKIGQEHVQHASWNNLTYFLGQIIAIFAKIYVSPKFNNT